MPKVLLVHDDIAEISAVKRVIARAGHQSVLATGSADALALLAQSPPAVVVVGGACDGGEALRRVAGSDEVRGIPIVVLGETADVPAGAALLPRPIDPARLAELLAAALRGGAPSPAPARKAAADALRARAEELRRGVVPVEDAHLEPPLGVAPPNPDRPSDAPAAQPSAAAPPRAPEPAAVAPFFAEEDDPGLEAILRRAEEAERAVAADGSAPDPANGSAERGAAARGRSRAEHRAPTGPRPRTDLEGELDRLERQLEADRPGSNTLFRSAIDRAASERAAAARRGQEEDARRREDEEARRRGEEEARRRDVDEEEVRSAIASARAEMEALRRRSEDEARRRAETEAELARVSASMEPQAHPASEASEEAARRRVAALREKPVRPAPSADPHAISARSVASAAEPQPEPAAPLRPPLAELRAGTLADLPAPRLLALAARSELSGRVDFEGEASRSIYFEDGSVVGATSSDPAERVEELALRLGLVTREQHRQLSSSAAPLATRRAALVLLERGFLKPTELTGLARRHTEDVAFGVFGDSGARFRWSAAEVPADERTALERTALALAVEGVRRRWRDPQVDAVLGGAGTLLSPVPAGPTQEELALSPGERRAVALADGLRTLDEIVAASPLDALSTRQALAALVLVGALAVRTFQGGRPAGATTADIDLARVRDKLDQVRRADYFAVLGVGRLCTPHEVREAFERLRAEFDPSRFQGVREDGLEGCLDEIRGVVADARDVLADDRLRHEYLRGLGA